MELYSQAVLDTQISILTPSALPWLQMSIILLQLVFSLSSGASQVAQW